MIDLNRAGAMEIAAAIRNREVAIVDVVEHFIQKQRKLNPKLNAVVENCWDSAYEEAILKDKELESMKEVPPLFGLPVTIKEMFSMDGFRNTLGSVHRRDFIQKYDATIVERLKKAGAIVLGSTNVPELGFWYECENPVYGWTKNPYDLKRTAGGSSGGEGAIIGAGASLFGVGSDVGGSIRLPAAFCGIFGHKPSNRIVPLTGHYPVEQTNAEDVKDPSYPLTVAGPMTRSAKDLRPILELMMGADGYDPCTLKNFKLKAPITDWSKTTVWLLPSPTMAAVSRATDDVVEAVEITGQYFESIGARVKRMKADVFRDGFSLWSAALNEVESHSTFEENLFNQQQLSALVELFKSFTARRQYTFPALGTVFLERLQNSYARQLEPSSKMYTRQLHELRKKLNKLLGENSFIVMPAHPRAAPLHQGTYVRPFDFAYAGVLNALKLPTTAAPVMMNAKGLPVGVQLVAGEFQDHVTLSAAEVVESAFGGWKPPENL